MSEKYEASTLDEQLEGIVAYVNAEADAARKSVRTQIIVLAVVGLILIGYFALANSWTREVTEPAELAKQGYILLDDNVPDLARSLEEVVNSATPDLADFINKQAVQQGVPFIVSRSEEYLAHYIDTMTKQTATYMEGTFDDVITGNRDAIRQAIAEQRTDEDPSLALKPLRDRMQATFVDKTTGKPTEARQSIDRTLVALKNLNKRLKALAAKDPATMSRREKMGSKLLGTYWQFIRSRRADDVETRQIPGATEGED